MQFLCNFLHDRYRSFFMLLIAAFSVVWGKHVASAVFVCGKVPLRKQSVFFVLINPSMRGLLPQDLVQARSRIFIFRDLHFPCLVLKEKKKRLFSSFLNSSFSHKKHQNVNNTLHGIQRVVKIRIELIDSPQQYHFKLDNVPVEYFQCTSCI